MAERQHAVEFDSPRLTFESDFQKNRGPFPRQTPESYPTSNVRQTITVSWEDPAPGAESGLGPREVRVSP